MKLTQNNIHKAITGIGLVFLKLSLPQNKKRNTQTIALY